MTLPSENIKSKNDEQLVLAARHKLHNKKRYFVMDVYDDKGLLIRGAYRKGDFIYYLPTQNRFTKKKLQYLFRGWVYRCEISFFCYTDKIKLNSFFKSEELLSAITDYENIKKDEESLKREVNKASKIRKDLDNINPLPKDFNGWLESKGDKWLLQDSKGKCRCTSCNKKFTLDALHKHLSTTNCPKCKTQVIVQRLNRCKKYLEDRTWGMMYDVGKDGTLMRRYILNETIIVVDKENEVVIRNDHSIKELAVVFDRNTNCNMEKAYGKHWGYSTRFYLTTSGMSPNKYFCGYTYLYPNNLDDNNIIERLGFFKESKGIIEKLISFSNKPELWHYLFYKAENNDDFYNKRMLFMEKLLKMHYYEFALDLMYRSDWEVKYRYDVEKSSLKEILGLNGEYYELFSQYGTPEAHLFIKSLKDKNIHISFDDLRLWVDSFGFNHASYIKKHGSVRKICNYIKSQSNYDSTNNRSMLLSEYDHYIDLLIKLEYPLNKKGYPKHELDKFPRNFRKTDERITKEYHDMMDRKKAEEKALMDKNYSDTINEISAAMRNSEDIQRFMEGTAGLLVKVPESAEELRQEGAALGNCVGTYVDRVANGETMIFFIRKIDNPDKSFFAMEYKDGKVKQLYTVGNTPDKTGKVIAFADALCKVLNATKFQPPKLAVA